MDGNTRDDAGSPRVKCSRAVVSVIAGPATQSECDELQAAAGPPLVCTTRPVSLGAAAGRGHSEVWMESIIGAHRQG